MENTNLQLACILANFIQMPTLLCPMNNNPPQKTSPSLWASRPIKYTILLAEPTHNPKRQLDCFTWFYRAMPQILHSLQWVAHYAPPKLSLSMEGLGPPFNTFFLDLPNLIPQMAFQLP